MLTKDQLKAEHYPIECWVNIYANNYSGMFVVSREAADRVKAEKFKVLYRIHVRLK